MKVNDIYEVLIENEDVNGNGVVRIDGIVTFVKNALKGEVLKIKIDSISKNYVTASILEYIKTSSRRIKPMCKYYDLCGGCNFLHTNYDSEINAKKEFVSRLFDRNVNILQNDDIYNYRNKVTLHVINGQLGYYDSLSHRLCEIDECILLKNKINYKITELKKYDLNGLSEIVIKCIDEETMVNIKGFKVNNELYKFPCDSLYINDEYVSGKKYLVDHTNNLCFSIYPESFYQVSKSGMESIYNKVLDYARLGNKLLDLYCGTGTIGIWLNKRFNDVIGVEINESSIKNANINLELNGINNVKFILGNSNIAKKYSKEVDVIVVDPPRSGLTKDVVRMLDESSAKRIVYVSCNPKTLKRDTDLLNNFVIDDISICNMFPRTKHCETVCVLERK